MFLENQPPEVFYKKASLVNLALFTRKGLCWSPFLRAPILKNICERLLLSVLNGLRFYEKKVSSYCPNSMIYHINLI